MESFNKVLIPTDGSDDAMYAVSKGLSLAKLIKAEEVIALYVKDLSPLSFTPEDDIILLVNTGLEDEGNAVLEKVVEEGNKMGVDVETIIVDGSPVDEILALANERDIDIIVMGTLGRTGIKRLLMGSVAEKVTRHAPCPVLIVRYKETESSKEGDEEERQEE